MAKHSGPVMEVHNYEVEDAARALERHQEVKSNKRLHRAAKAHLRKKKRMIEKAVKGK
jgi:hypothetical protein